ncbi:MAG: arylesterase [Leptospira sp.]|nr:arylesterase [Leptospira sp.]
MLKLIPLLLIFTFFSCGNDAETSNPSVPTAPNSESKSQRIIFFGDSLTAGYGLVDYEKAWPHLIVARLKKEGYTFEITNAGVSGDTSSGGLGRLDWVLSQKPNIFVLELGANDMLRGITPKVTRDNLATILRTVKKTYPNCEILLIGMKSTPNLGSKYRDEFDAIYPDLAKSENVMLVPFLLEKVASDRKLNQKDGIHPTEEGHVLVSESVYPYLKKLAKKVQVR